MKCILIIAAVLFSSVGFADSLATIKLNPLEVELSKEARNSISEFDKNFIYRKFDDYSDKVQKIFLDDSESLNRETPMVALGYFDCDSTMDLAVMGISRGKDVVLALLSSKGFKATQVPALRGEKAMIKTAPKSTRYISINQNIPLKPSTCRGARKTIDLIQSEEAFSGDTHAFYYNKGKWLLYTGQDL